MTSSDLGHKTGPRFARGNASLTVLILNGPAVEVDARTVTTEQARAAVDDYFGASAEVARLREFIGEAAGRVESDRREPDKLLCHVARMRRLLLDADLAAEVQEDRP